MVYTVLIGNSAAVNRRGKSETCPATARGRKAPRYRRSLRAMSENGMMTSRMAFSWTCQPKRKDAYPQRVTEPMNVSHVGSKKSFMRGIIWKRRVRAKVVRAVTSGSTANEVSPTRPRVTLVRASSLTGRLRRGATGAAVSHVGVGAIEAPTKDQQPVCE